MEAPPPTLSLSLTLTQPQPMEALYSVAWRLDTLSHGGSILCRMEARPHTPVQEGSLPEPVRNLPRCLRPTRRSRTRPPPPDLRSSSAPHNS